MKKYKVLTCILQGKRKDPFEGGAEVTENDFETGHCPQLVEQGFLEEIENEDDVKKSEEEKDSEKALDEKIEEVNQKNSTKKRN